jgi:hypothetical protein
MRRAHESPASIIRAEMNASNAANSLEPGEPNPVKRARLVRDRSVVERFGLQPAGMYRVAYVAGATQSRRVSRSLAVFHGVSERRRWNGETALCLDFVLPQGRPLSLLPTQVVDVRPAGQNEQGQWVLVAHDAARRRHRARLRTRPVS